MTNSGLYLLFIVIVFVVTLFTMGRITFGKVLAAAFCAVMASLPFMYFVEGGLQ